MEEHSELFAESLHFTNHCLITSRRREPEESGRTWIWWRFKILMSAPRNLLACLSPNYINQSFLISWRQLLEIFQLSKDEGQGQYSTLFFLSFFVLSETFKQICASIHLEILMQKVIKTVAEKNPMRTNAAFVPCFKSVN